MDPKRTGAIKNLASTSTEAYANAFEALQSQSVDWALLEQLKPEFAATGDNFEVAKFLPALLEEDYGLSKEHNEHIAVVLQHLAHQHSWDPYDSWPAILFQSNNSNTAESIDSSTITPKALQSQSVDWALLEQLKPEFAATGDNFEVAKFLVVLLHELRISQPALLEEDYGLSKEHNEHIAVVLQHLAHQHSWDPYDSWPAILFQSNNINTAESIDSSTITPKVQELDDWRSRAAEAENELNGLKQQWKALKEMLSTCQVTKRANSTPAQ
ncbi:unnamed protein product [Gongylonema pulchrum]|uniref:Nuclear pore complex protein Nup85 n=1 Tax=Gongylonema pulchrum TaxID=637853 RepID=A0A183DNT0_9BILA|nr:unnamed protein product [Gongylonema pulchrum]